MATRSTLTSVSSAISFLILSAAAGVTESSGVVWTRSEISIAKSSYPTIRLYESPDFVTVASRSVEPFSGYFVRRRDLLGSPALEGEEPGARQRAAVPDLRGLR